MILVQKRRMFVAVTVIICIATVILIDGPVSRYLVRSRNEKTRAILQELAIDVEAVRLKFGAAPTNEEHLIRILGKPLPRSGWNEDINYENVDGNFRLETFSPYPHWQTFEYNSLHPTSGVVVHTF